MVSVRGDLNAEDAKVEDAKDAEDQLLCEIPLPPLRLNLPLITEDDSPPACESCGQAFACGATLAGCWCAEVKLTETVRAELRRRFQRCLCRACLERFAVEDGAREDS